MTKVDLTDAKAKLDRACKHISDINTEVAGYSRADFYRIGLQPQKGTDRVKMVFESLHQPSKAVNVMLGDAVGNLRSALDYIAVALIAPIGGNVADIGFPFAENFQSWQGEVTAPRRFRSCDARIIDLLVNTTQAYKGGNGNTLWVLNKLRNIDKHRLLVTTTNVATVLVSFTMGNTTFEGNVIQVEEGKSGSFLRFPVSMAEEIKFTKEPQAAFTVELTESPYITKVNVLDFLRDAGGQIESLLNALDVIV